MSTARGLLALLILSPVLALLVGVAVFAVRLAQTWTSAETHLLLGGALGICGASMSLVGVLVGAGLFARLAGTPRRRRSPDPYTIDLPPSHAVPRITGGGSYELLPYPREQDEPVAWPGSDLGR